MSEIVIRGIEFPKEGTLALLITSSGEVYRIPRKYCHSETVVATGSEAVELPEPHGDLIDKNKFLEVVEKFRDAFEKEGDADFVKRLLTHTMFKPVLEASE